VKDVDFDQPKQIVCGFEKHFCKGCLVEQEFQYTGCEFESMFQALILTAQHPFHQN
jgi:hypothetical protein